MMITSLINYLISMLQMKLSETFLMKIDKIINNFVWQGKKPRISLIKLKQTKDKGGVGLPNFKAYQTAFLCKQVAAWFFENPTYRPLWLEVEQHLTKGIPLSALMTMNIPSLPHSKYIIQNTKQALFQLEKLSNVKFKTSNMTSL